MAEPTLEDVVEELKKQTDLSKVAVTIAEATKIIVSKPGGNIRPAARPPGATTTWPGLSPASQETGPKAVETYKLVEHDAKRVVQPTEQTAPKPRKPPKPPKPGFMGRLGRMVGKGLRDRMERSRVGRAYSRGKGSFGKVLKTMMPPGAGGSGGGGRAAKGGGAAVAAVTAVVQVAEKLNEFRKAVTRATEEQLAAARRLKDINAEMAVTFANEEVKNLMRDLRTAKATSASTAQLSDANQRRKDSMEGLEQAVTNISNQTLAFFNDTLVPLLKTISDVAQFVERNWPIMWLRWGRPPEAPPAGPPIGEAAVLAAEAAGRAAVRDLRKAAEDAARGMGAGVVMPPGGRP